MTDLTDDERELINNLRKLRITIGTTEFVEQSDAAKADLALLQARRRWWAAFEDKYKVEEQELRLAELRELSAYRAADLALRERHAVAWERIAAALEAAR